VCVYAYVCLCSVVSNFFLNVHSGSVGPGPLLPGMANVTQQQYEALVVSQLTELWTQYGELTERT
jgi:alpha-L-fucosidase